MSNEIKYQSLFGSKWDDCSKIVYDSLPDSQRRIAPLNVSVQEEKRELIETPFGAVCEINEGVYGEKLVQDIYMATQGGLGNTPPKPSPAHTEPTTNAGIDKGEGVREKVVEIIADNLYNIRNEKGHPMLYTDKCDEIAQLIYNEIASALTGTATEAVELPLPSSTQEVRPPESFLTHGEGNFRNCTDYDDAIQAIKDYHAQFTTTPVAAQEVRTAIDHAIEYFDNKDPHQPFTAQQVTDYLSELAFNADQQRSQL